MREGCQRQSGRRRPAPIACYAQPACVHKQECQHASGQFCLIADFAYRSTCTSASLLSNPGQADASIWGAEDAGLSTGMDTGWRRVTSSMLHLHKPSWACIATRQHTGMRAATQQCLSCLLYMTKKSEPSYLVVIVVYDKKKVSLHMTTSR